VFPSSLNIASVFVTGHKVITGVMETMKNLLNDTDNNLSPVSLTPVKKDTGD
jgi:hypothetical protein